MTESDQVIDVSVSTKPQPDFDPRRSQHQEHVTDTWYEQFQVEERVQLIRKASTAAPQQPLLLRRDKHVKWLIRSLRVIPSGYQAFDSLQSWLAFWIVHSLNVLGATIPSTDSQALVTYLTTFRDTKRGGYGGGPRQSAHLASTFSAVMALCSIGSDEALSSIDVPSMSRFLYAMKQTDGSFRVSEDGEADARAVYCALALATLLHIAPMPSRGARAADHTLFRNVGEYVASLQAFDGGLGGEPGAEAHGGNTYCALAALVLSGGADAVDRDALLDWAVMRQMPFEGGFQGRTNKLVDSCYSFWVGALFPLMTTDDPTTTSTATMNHPITQMFDADALQRYILECCQLGNGGLRDKPGTARDLMHTCYSLSGLAVAQHYGGATVTNAHNRVSRINVVYNLREDRLRGALRFFNKDAM